MKITEPNENDEPVVRRDLTETAFRRYEHVIAEACARTIVVDPEDLSVHTFATRVRDAIRGYRMYGYSSKLIPQGSDVSRIRVVELRNGRVKLQNSYSDTRGERPRPAPIGKCFSTANRDAVLRHLSEVIAGPLDATGYVRTRLIVDSADSARWLESLPYGLEVESTVFPCDFSVLIHGDILGKSKAEDVIELKTIPSWFPKDDDTD